MYIWRGSVLFVYRKMIRHAFLEHTQHRAPRGPTVSPRAQSEPQDPKRALGPKAMIMIIIIIISIIIIIIMIVIPE